MNMNDISKFIKDHSGYINNELYRELYLEAYEWLSDEQTAELTKMLAKALNIDSQQYAIDTILEKFEESLKEFENSRHDNLILSSFIRMYMNHINGIDYDEFAHFVSMYMEKHPHKHVEVFDDGFDLYIKQV